MIPRRAFVPLLAGLGLLAGCGDPDSIGSGGTTTSTVAGIAHPTGAGDVVLQVGYTGGFVPVELAFNQLPWLTVYGDGTVITPAVTTEIYPGPLVAPLQQRHLSEAGLQRLLDKAQAAGLLATPPSYDSAAADGIADAATTELVLDAGGGRWEHAAYALAEGEADTPERAALAEFVAALGDLGTLVGPAELGAEEPYDAERFRLRATPDPQPPDELEPTVRPWPADAVDLAGAAECGVADAPLVGPAFTNATQLTWFTQGDATYSLVVRPLLPGDPGC